MSVEKRSKATEPRGPNGWVPRGYSIRPRGPPRLALEPPFARFLRPHVFFLPNIDARKFPGDFVDVWVPETLKYKTRVFCLCRVNSIKIGNKWIFPKIIIKHWYNPYMMQIWLKYKQLKCKVHVCILHASPRNSLILVSIPLSCLIIIWLNSILCKVLSEAGTRD